MTNAVVVGSGPNGLAAAITLAGQGIDVRVVEAKATIGGGTRSSDLGNGLIHDDCSAFHPAGLASPFMAGAGLGEYGLEWLWPEIQVAHPLDGGRAALLWQDVARTAEVLGEDGEAWTKLFGRLAHNFDDLAADVFRPIVHVPAHPVTLARFGLNALRPATWSARRWRTDEARALFGGIAAHGFGPLGRPLSSAVALMLGGAAHAYGWPVAKGGSQSISKAMARKLYDLDGSIETGIDISTFGDLGDPDVVMLDTSAAAAIRILGDRLPANIGRSYRRFRYGPAAYKVDFAIEGHIPWANADVGRAGTVHLGGTIEDIDTAETEITRGTMPAQPFVLVGQQYLADPSRSAGDINPIWAYGHVPNGYAGDATEAIIDQIERFAPGFRTQIKDHRVRNVAAMESYNANCVGGDIGAGASTGLQTVMRPRIAIDPYKTGIPGVYLCSASTPPGAGVHGMCGFNAANSALADL